ISATFWTIVSPGDHVLVDKTVYGCTFSFMEHGLKKFGIQVTYVDFTNIDKIKGALQSNTRVVYFESPVNPSMRILDIEQISSLVKDYCADIHVVIDNTY
ncbi:MAG: aminotransferase class I/II-fold pyridoxal phosphate-dependent enzyme, partial [Porticoccaceae bacterium]